MTNLQYRPEIDGLRAIAVIAVFLFHFGIGTPGGYVGVDIFFVISGYLITKIIWRELEKEAFSLSNFWSRRIKRILPALFVMVFVSLSFGVLLFLPKEIVDLGYSSVMQALMLSNVYFWLDSGYFTGPAETKPLLHTWSLAVEEQFYIFFPLILCTFKKFSKKRLFVILLLFAIISFCGSIYGVSNHPGASFFLLPTRAWELLVGCLLAVCPWTFQESHRRDSLLATLGLVSISYPFFNYNESTSFPGLSAVPPVLGTAAIIFATGNSPRIWLSRVLSIRPLVFVGLISYSLYLWHWPVIVYLKSFYGDLEPLQLFYASILSSALAILSWWFVERPLRSKEILKTHKYVFLSAALVIMLNLFVGLTFIFSNGFQNRLPPNANQLLADTIFPGTEYSTPKTTEFDILQLPTLGKEHDNSKKQIDFILWGDSHAVMFSQIISDIATEEGLSGKVMAWGGQVAGPDIEYVHNNREKTDALMKWLNKHRPRNLILANSWSGRTHGPTYLRIKNRQGKLENQFISDKLHNSSSYKESTEVWLRSLQKLTKFCEQRRIDLWIIKQVPEINEPYPARDLLMYSLGKKSHPPNIKTNKEKYLSRIDRPNQIFSSLSSPKVHFLDPAPYFFDKKNEVIVIQSGRSNYYDDNHLSYYGSQKLTPLFTEMFKKMRVLKGQQETISQPNEIIHD